MYRGDSKTYEPCVQNMFINLDIIIVGGRPYNKLAILNWEVLWQLQLRIGYNDYYYRVIDIWMYRTKGGGQLWVSLGRVEEEGTNLNNVQIKVDFDMEKNWFKDCIVLYCTS